MVAFLVLFSASLEAMFLAVLVVRYWECLAKW